METSTLARTLATTASEYALPGPEDELPQRPYRPEEGTLRALRQVWSESLSEGSRAKGEGTPAWQLHLFSGRWCGDCRREVPRLVQVLTQVLFQPEPMQGLQGVEFYPHRVAVDRASPTMSIRMEKIVRLPTLVLLHRGREVGRVEERPRPSWEGALLGLLEGRSPRER